MGSERVDEQALEIQSVRTYQIGALPVLYPILEALQVGRIVNEVAQTQAAIDLGRVVVLLTLNRLMQAKPLSQVGRWLAGTILAEVVAIEVEQIYDMRLGRALDQLYPFLGEVWARLVCQAIEVYNLDLGVLHWDITSLYLEGAYRGSELAQYGYSRDHRPDTKQVNLEVDVSHDSAAPILYQLLAGNTADITRPVAHLRGLLDFLARPELQSRHFRPILVSDSKMITPDAVFACHQHHLFYLGPLADTQATTQVLQSVSPSELQSQPLAYRPQRVDATATDFVAYCGVWRTFRFERAGQSITDRVLVVWSAGKARLDEQRRKTYLKRLLNRLADIQRKLNQRRYKRRGYVEQRLQKVQQGNPMRTLVEIDLQGEDGALTLVFRLNRLRLAEAQALDGRYLLATNAAQLDANQALTLFKGQDRVEKCFRTAKGPLQLHPLFVRSDQRIEGVVFVTLLALLVRAILTRLLQSHSELGSIDHLLAQFAPLQAVELRWADDRRQRRCADLTPTQAHSLQTLGWPRPAVYLR